MEVEQKTMSFFCVGCENVFVIPSRRGRPPSKCESCLAKENPVVQTEVSEDKIVVSGKVHPSMGGVKMMNLFCHACNEVFAFPARRGRPPKYCSNCIESGAAETSEEQRQKTAIIKANLRCDNLEMLLKSRGTHIRQNPQYWE